MEENNEEIKIDNIKEEIKEELLEEVIEEPVIEQKEEPVIEQKEKILEEIIKKPVIKNKKEIKEPIKKKRRNKNPRKIFLIMTFMLVLLSLGVNGFVLYKGIDLFGDAQWLVSANICTKFDKQIWIETHCINQEGVDVCGFKDGYKNIILSLKQVEQISETDLLFCSEYSPYGETFVRLAEGYKELEGGINK